jgi:hypothetical protein
MFAGPEPEGTRLRYAVVEDCAGLAGAEPQGIGDGRHEAYHVLYPSSTVAFAKQLKDLDD